MKNDLPGQVVKGFARGVGWNVARNVTNRLPLWLQITVVVAGLVIWIMTGGGK